MTLSLISVAVLFITALVIVIEVVRAINRGRSKTLVTLASLFLAIFLSIFITKFLSNLLADRVLKLVKSAVDVSEIADKLPSIDNILLAYSDSLVAPLLFLFVFLAVRIVIAIVIKIVYSVISKKSDNKIYETEEAPDYKKNPKVINGLLGALCGLLVMVVAITPLMGSLKIVTKTFHNMNEEEGAFNIKVKESAILYFDRCSDDCVGNLLYYCGGNLIYRSVASSELNENYFGLEREIDNTFSTAGDLLSMNKVLNNIDTATEEEKDMLRNLGANVDKAETLKAATADILPVLAKKWLNDEPYEGAKKPKVSKACDSFFNKMLYVCKSSTPDTVGADLSTLLNVYLIAHENDILISENYKDMIEKAKTTGAFDLIKKELEKNPRMSGVSLELDTMGVKSIASAIQSINVENYENFVGNITNVLNTALTLEGQARFDYVNNLTKQYIYEHGINVGDDIAYEISERLIDELVDHRNGVTADDIKNFLDKYSVKENSESDGNNVTPIIPTPEVPPIMDESESIVPDDTYDGAIEEPGETVEDTENENNGEIVEQDPPVEDEIGVDDSYMAVG